MKNKFIIHASINFKGGVGTVIKNLIIYQVNQGFKVGVLYMHGCEDELSIFSEVKDKIELIPFRPVNFKGINTLRGMPIKKTYKMLSQRYPDENIIFHSHNAASVGIFSPIKGVPLICTVHGVNEGRGSLSQYATKIILSKLLNTKKRITFVSKSTAQYYFKNWADDYQIKVVNNGLNINKEGLEAKGDYFNIGYVSYIDDLKGWRVLFEAFLMLIKDGSYKIKLIIAGEGPEEEIKQLKNLIEKHKLGNAISYRGYVENAGERIVPLLDLLVLPSKSEGMPMVILEALGKGIPVLASSVGGIPEVLVNGYNGMFIKRDVEDIYYKLKTLIEDRDIYHVIAQNAYSSYRKSFTMEAMGRQYDDIYLEIIEGYYSR